jgi:hypothetical protein
MSTKMSSVADAHGGSGQTAAPSHAVNGAADWLCLAAAPTFAAMALITAVFGGGHADMLCMSAHDAPPLSAIVSGMVPMYGLMSAFHLAPWLKLISPHRV